MRKKQIDHNIKISEEEEEKPVVNKKQQFINNTVWVVLIVGIFGIFLFWNIHTNTVQDDKASKANGFDIHIPENKNLEKRFGVVFDLGSSGTRAHVFSYQRNKFEDCVVSRGGGIDNLVPASITEGKPSTFKTKQPISSQAENPSLAGKSLEPLFEFVYSIIPSHDIPNTPFFAFATAGLRVIAEKENRPLHDDDDEDLNTIFEEDDDNFGEGTVESILSSIRKYVKENTSFLFVQNDQIRVLKGEEEGTFDYLSIQQLLRNDPYSRMDDANQPIFDTPEKQYDNADIYSVGTIDLGGASTQLSFAIYPRSAISSDIKILPPLFSNNPQINLFTHSFLNYGVNQFREIYLQLLLNEYLSIHSLSHDGDDENAKITITDPCMLKDLNDEIVINNRTILFSGSSVYSACKSQIGKFFESDFVLNCGEVNCAMKQVQLIPFTPGLRFIAFDHAYRIASNLGFSGYTNIYSLNKKIADLFRFSFDEISKIYSSVPEVEAKKMPFESSYLFLLLTSGYHFDLQSTVKIGFSDYVGGYNLNWALGAMVHESYLLCKSGHL